MRDKSPGVWIPETAVKALLTLRLKSSEWRVLLDMVYQ